MKRENSNFQSHYSLTLPSPINPYTAHYYSRNSRRRGSHLHKKPKKMTQFKRLVRRVAELKNK